MRWLVTTTVLWPNAAHADLQQDVTRLLGSAGKLTVYHLGPRILEQGEELPLLVPPSVASGATPGCAHVIVIGAQSVHFVAEISGMSAQVASRAGFLELVRCGESRHDLASVSVTMLSMRGPLEALALSTPLAEPMVGRVLPTRSVGVEAAERTLTRQPELPRLGAWLRSLEGKAQLHGATRTERRSLPPQDKELGETLVGFDPGCHEVQLLADVDWETLEDTAAGVHLVWEDDGEIAASETLHTRAPTLRVCTAQPRTAQLRFPGLPQSVAGVLFRARYEWPAGVPSHWTNTVRTRIAQALLQRHLRSLASAPARSWMGGGAALALEVPVATQACYVAVVAATAEAADIDLAVTSGARLVADSSLDDSAASAAFCPEGRDSVMISVDARDPTTTWILGLWKVAPLPAVADLW